MHALWGLEPRRQHTDGSVWDKKERLVLRPSAARSKEYIGRSRKCPPFSRHAK